VSPLQTRGLVGWLIALGVTVAPIGLAAIAFRDQLVSRWILGGLGLAMFLAQLALFRWRVGGVGRASVAALLVIGVAVGAWRLDAPLSPLAWAWPSPEGGVVTSAPTADTSLPPAVPTTAPAEGPWSKLQGATVGCREAVRSSANIADLKDDYSAPQWRKGMIGVLDRRYPNGAWIVSQLAEPSFFDAWFSRGKGDWPAAMTELSTGVHESAHMVGLAKRPGGRHALVNSREETLSFPIVPSFHRSEIKPDLPPSIRALSYTATYLEGQSGAQGFEMVLEELNAYIHSLLVAVAIADQLPGNLRQSSRDGLLVFLYYTESYLARARKRDDSLYRQLSTGDIRDAILILFGRAGCALQLSSPYHALGIDDVMLREHVYGERGLGEVVRLR
jgi:hypothetical protein